MTDKEIRQRQIANEVQEILGEDYQIRFDDCESGMTRIYHKILGRVIREVPNETFQKGMSITELAVNRDEINEIMVLRLM